MPLAVEAWSLNHWTTREVLLSTFKHHYLQTLLYFFNDYLLALNKSFFGFGYNNTNIKTLKVSL